MEIARIAGCTRVLGEAQGYLALPIRDDVAEGGVPLMVSEWHPTDDERAALVAGAPLYLTVLGSMHPPVVLDVGNAPAGEAPE